MRTIKPMSAGRPFPIEKFPPQSSDRNHPASLLNRRAPSPPQDWGGGRAISSTNSREGAKGSVVPGISVMPESGLVRNRFRKVRICGLHELFQTCQGQHIPSPFTVAIIASCSTIEVYNQGGTEDTAKKRKNPLAPQVTDALKNAAELGSPLGLTWCVVQIFVVKCPRPQARRGAKLESRPVPRNTERNIPHIRALEDSPKEAGLWCCVRSGFVPCSFSAVE